MKREMEPYQLIERSIIKKYRKELWTPFIVAVKRYELIKAGDKIAVCISGGKDSMLMAKLMQELQRSFFAYTLYSRNIIGRISHKRLQIDYLRRR